MPGSATPGPIRCSEDDVPLRGAGLERTRARTASPAARPGAAPAARSPYRDRAAAARPGRRQRRTRSVGSSPHNGRCATAAGCCCRPISLVTRPRRRRQQCAGGRSGARPPARNLSPGPCIGRSERVDGACRPDCHLSAATVRRLHLRRCGEARALFAGTRHQPSLRVALSHGTRRLHARLRHRRSQRDQPGIRRRSRVRPLVGGAQGGRHRADPRFRAQPHGGCPCGQFVVARCARIWRKVGLCGSLRHRLGSAAAPARRRRAGADPRRTVWRGIGERRDRR